MKKGMYIALAVSLLLPLVAGLAGAEKAHLVVTWCCAQVERKTILEETVKSYMASHPNVEIELIGPGNYSPTIQTWIVGGNAPDIMWYGVNWPALLDSVMPVDSFLAKTGLDRAIHPSILNMLRWDGQVRGVPYGAGAHVVYLNKSIFATAGLATPKNDWTWDDTIAIARRLTVDKNGDNLPDQWGISFDAEWQIHPFLWGGDFYTADKRKAQFNNPATVAGMQLYADIRSGAIRIHGGRFSDGNLAMYPDGAFSLAPARGYSFDWDLVNTPILRVNGKDYRNNFMGPESWFIYKGTKYPEIAQDFVQVLLSEAVMSKWGRSGTSIPSQPRFASQYFAANPPRGENLMTFVNALDYGHVNHQTHPIGLNIQTYMFAQDVWKRLWAGQLPAASALPELEKGVNAMLDEYWASKGR